LFSTLGARRLVRTNFILAAAAMTAVLTVGAGIAAGAGGGVGTPDPPRITDVTCVSGCAGLRAAAPASTVALDGSGLGAVTSVKFNDRDGGRIRVEPLEVSSNRVQAKVPDGAATGRARVEDSYGRTADSPTELEIVEPDAVQSPGSFELQEASAINKKAFYAGRRKAGIQFVFAGDSAQDVRIDVVERGGGGVVASNVEKDVEPGQPATVKWNGETESGKVAPNGDYRFEIGPASGGAGGGGESTNFAQFDHMFPVRGKHEYGDGVGAPRDGHTHQGQDVFADCGTKLVAARGGRVQTKAYHDAAGYYLVIDGKKTDQDYVYMHLKRESPFKEGDRVGTGDKIGKVGETGNASGCHLHFELWSGPGWYEGGHFKKSVTRQMKEWDSWS
jgi:murein DD-endopeptidase MepM/ murein hydrolase activator NlpD